MKLNRYRFIANIILVSIIASVVTWQGKRNLAWFISQVFDRDCFVDLLFIKCE